MNPKLLQVISVVVLLAMGAAIGRFTLPAKVVTKTETQTVTKVDTKTVEVDKTDYYKNKVLVETVTTKPDGTVIRKREFVDKSVVHKDDETNTNTASNTTSSSSTETSKTYSNDKVSVRALVARNLDSLSKDIYGVGVDKKILGLFTLGAFGLTDKTIGLSLGMSF